MVKNLSLILNIVLVAAVGYLYYYNFSGKKPGLPASRKDGSVPWKDSICSHPLIAYVELDSLNEKITSIRDKRKEMEAQQKSIEAEAQNSYKVLMAKRDNFLKQKGATASQDEAEKFQAQLMAEQQQIENKKQQRTQALSETNFTFLEDVQKKLKKFLSDYNSDKKYMYILTTGTGLDYLVYKDSTLNITDDVVKGMNEELKKGSNN